MCYIFYKRLLLTTFRRLSALPDKGLMDVRYPFMEHRCKGLGVKVCGFGDSGTPL